MKNENLGLFTKGNFKKINNNFMVEGHEVLQQVKAVQEKYHKNDTDTFINELRDSITGYTLGFDLVNVEKHGFDCKMSDKDVFLEVKSASFDARTWQATFNDTTYEKVEAFKTKKLFLALAIWKDASDLLFVAYGQNSNIGIFLEKKVRWFKAGNTVRSTQSISLQDLVFKYNFKLLSIDKSKKELLELLRLKNKVFSKLEEKQIVILSDFKSIYY